MTDPVAFSAAGSALASAQTQELSQLKSVAQQFEAVFLRQMIGSMRTASLGEGIMDSSASEQFRDMSDAKTADQMAGQGALHIADLLVKQYGARLAPAAAADAKP